MTRLPYVLLASFIMTSACGRDEPADPLADRSETTSETGSATSATTGVHVALSPTAGQTAAGMLMVSETDDGVAIEGRITGLEPDSELGFHIHETGDCSAPDASSAGEHFNPTGQPHGDPDSDTRHLGDMANLEVSDDGDAIVDVTLEDVTLDGTDGPSIRNRAIVVHAREDDYETQPSGASGARIACGVIGGEGMVDPQTLDPGAVQTPGAGKAPAPPQP